MGKENEKRKRIPPLNNCTCEGRLNKLECLTMDEKKRDLRGREAVSVRGEGERGKEKEGEERRKWEEKRKRERKRKREGKRKRKGKRKRWKKMKKGGKIKMEKKRKRKGKLKREGKRKIEENKGMYLSRVALR